MSTTNNTGKKLIDSMRMTKGAADASPRPSGEPKGAAKESRRPSVRKKARSATPAPAADQANREADPYQSGRRVWPD